MSRVSELSQAQQKARAERIREGRLDTAAMSNRLRRALGLMDRQQAAEHERLRTLPHARLAERSRKPLTDDPWAVRGESDAA